MGQKHILVILLCLACVSLGCASRNPYVTGGIIDMQQSRYESAEVKFKQALEIEPENSDAHMWLGKSYASQRKFTKAADHFDKAISINPSQKSEFGREPRYFWAIYYNSGMDFIEDEAWDSAEKRLLSTVEIIPDSIGPYTQLSYVYTKQDKQDQAQDILNKAIKKAPDNMSVRVSLARYKIKNESYEDAKSMLKEVVSRDPDNAKAHYYLGLVFSKTKNSKEAEGEFAQAAKLDSTDRDAFFNLGTTRMALKKYGEAAEAFKQVIKLDPTDEESWLQWGICYYHAKNYDLAIETFTKWIEHDPKNPDAYLNRGYARSAKGQKSEAYEDIRYGEELQKRVRGIEYKVTGSARLVDVTYQNRGGGTSQETGVPIPWSYSLRAEPGDVVQISAQNTGESGTVTVTIYRDGSVFKSSTSTGAHSIASANGVIE